MLDGEPEAAARRIPLDLDDGAGGEYTGAAPSGTEVLISISGAAWQTAAGTVSKLRDGDYYYEASAAEVRGRGFRLLRLAKSGMGTAMFDFYCGNRRALDPSGVARRIPVILEDSGGSPVTGITLTGAEIEISNNGGAFTTGAGTAAEIGYGAYYYEPTVSEYSRGHSMLNVNDAGAEEFKYEVIIDQEYLPTLAGQTTTAESIRDRIIDVIEALTPTSLSGDKFRAYRNEGAGFTDWCESKPVGAFRRFQVLETGSDAPPETSSGVEEERTATFQVVIAYPRTARYGADQGLDRHDVMREDQRLIERAIGMHGKANFTSPFPAATWLMDGSATDRQDGEACDYLVVTQRMLFVLTW